MKTLTCGRCIIVESTVSLSKTNTIVTRKNTDFDAYFTNLEGWIFHSTYSAMYFTSFEPENDLFGARDNSDAFESDIQQNEKKNIESQIGFESDGLF